MRQTIWAWPKRPSTARVLGLVRCWFFGHWPCGAAYVGWSRATCNRCWELVDVPPLPDDKEAM